MLLFLNMSNSSKFKNTEYSNYQADDSCSDIGDCPDMSIDSALIDYVIKDDNTEQECRDVLTNLLNTVHDNTLLSRTKVIQKEI